jgi:hypothetical protein
MLTDTLQADLDGEYKQWEDVTYVALPPRIISIADFLENRNSVLLRERGYS